MVVTKVLIDGEADLVSGKLIAQLEQLKEEYKITFEFNCPSNPQWHNIVHFTTKDADVYMQDGSNIPCVRSYDSCIYVYASINGIAHCYFHYPYNANMWHSVAISQEKVNGDFMYSVAFDGVNIHNVVNTQPKVYNNVKVYAGDPWHPAVGKIRNLVLSTPSEIDPVLQCWEVH